MEKCKYITIEREYGSGGTEIARLLAGQTGIPCYGQEILEEVSRERDIPVEKIQRYEETVTNSFLYSIYMMTQFTSGKNDMLTAEGHIYVAEQAVIRRLAGNGPAVFLGLRIGSVEGIQRSDECIHTLYGRRGQETAHCG